MLDLKDLFFLFNAVHFPKPADTHMFTKIIFLIHHKACKPVISSSLASGCFWCSLWGTGRIGICHLGFQGCTVCLSFHPAPGHSLLWVWPLLTLSLFPLSGIYSVACNVSEQCGGSLNNYWLLKWCFCDLLVLRAFPSWGSSSISSYHF